jgi:hypothetical protein
MFELSERVLILLAFYMSDIIGNPIKFPNEAGCEWFSFLEAGYQWQILVKLVYEDLFYRIDEI